MENLNYGGLEEEYTAYDKAEIVVLPVPYDGTSTWIKGADKGPDALLEASANMELYDIETDSEVYRKGIATVEPVSEASSPEAMSQEVERRGRCDTKRQEVSCHLRRRTLRKYRSFPGFCQTFR